MTKNLVSMVMCFQNFTIHRLRTKSTTTASGELMAVLRDEPADNSSELNSTAAHEVLYLKDKNVRRSSGIGFGCERSLLIGTYFV